MLTRKNQIIVRLNDDELSRLKSNVKKSGLSQAAYLRILITGYVPKERPDDRFYIVMRQLIGIGNNMHQIARKANALNFIDTPALNAALKKFDDFEEEVTKRFLDPDKME